MSGAERLWVDRRLCLPINARTIFATVLQGASYSPAGGAGARKNSKEENGFDNKNFLLMR